MGVAEGSAKIFSTAFRKSSIAITGFAGGPAQNLNDRRSTWQFKMISLETLTKVSYRHVLMK